MAFSIQTNVNSLVAQENLRVNQDFQGKTIQRLTSGFRINASGDDAAGLAIANKFRSDTAELTQGVRNANDGISQLQIIDGGLNNITKMLDRLKTLATQSASTTFTGDRNTLNNEYQTLLGEIDRQAANINLVAGGTANTTMTVHIGGGSSQTNAKVTIDLSGTANQVDSAALKLKTTNVAASGTGLTGNSVLLTNAAGDFTGTETFTFHIAGQSSDVTISYNGAGVAIGDGAAAVSKLNAQTSKYGITASIGSDGKLQFSGGVAFSVITDVTAGTALTDDAAAADYNKGMYAITGTAPNVSAGSETVTITNANGSVNLTFDSTTGGTVGNAIAYMNDNLNSIGIYAVKDSAGTGYTLQSASTFTVNKTAAAGTGAVFAGAVGAKALTNASPTSTGAAADAALSAITDAIKQLGLVQGRVGTGQNQLSYAITLAQSQISNFSAAESRIRDADVAAEAANLTKAQVLQQASIAAMAQANSAPQAVLSLLRG
jgi:flagellin